MDAATIAQLRRGAAALGVPLDDQQLAALDRYLGLLGEWNRRINLTAVVEPVAMVERHLLDSLAVASLVAAATTLVDVGSGAGFPGAVLAVALPRLTVTAVESIHKKAAFLQTLRREVAPNLTVLCARVETVHAQFEAAVSRATWDPAEWLVRGAPLVAPGGLLVAMQGVDPASLSPPAGFVALPARDYEIAGVRRRLAPFRRSG
jgi:16S rRNA (guanine527-N7)-methyltransferase